jgi:hypothetical protein
VNFFTRSGSYISALACDRNQQMAPFTDYTTSAFQSEDTLIDGVPARRPDQIASLTWFQLPGEFNHIAIAARPSAS